ncbi:MAG: alpha/beta fold hydrolase [Dehalococcoidia bacterium]|nr:alpha/beta fold hydrolase [Dehalococcoidia bacterium]
MDTIDCTPAAGRKEDALRDGFVVNDGVRIHYQVEGSGPPLFLHHGFTGSSQSWRDFGYTKEIADGYTLVLIDARGQGASDKPYDVEANTMERRTDDIRLVLDELEIDRVHFWGYSMGGRTAFAFVQRYPDRLRSLVIGGASPYVVPESTAWNNALAVAAERGDAAMLAGDVEGDMAFMEEGLRRSDRKALAATQRGIMKWPGVDPATITTPALLYCPTEDPRLGHMEKAAAAMGTKLHLVQGKSHAQGFYDGLEVIPAVRGFLAGVERGDAPRAAG